MLSVHWRTSPAQSERRISAIALAKNELIASGRHDRRDGPDQGNAQWTAHFLHFCDGCVFVGISHDPVYNVIVEIHAALLALRIIARHRELCEPDDRVQGTNH